MVKFLHCICRLREMPYIYKICIVAYTCKINIDTLFPMLNNIAF